MYNSGLEGNLQYDVQHLQSRYPPAELLLIVLQRICKKKSHQCPWKVQCTPTQVACEKFLIFKSLKQKFS